MNQCWEICATRLERVSAWKAETISRHTRVLTLVSLMCFLTSWPYDGFLWKPFLLWTSHIWSTCFFDSIKWGNSLKWAIMLFYVWYPEQVFLVSRFTSSTYSSMAILLFFPPLRFINLFHTRRSVWLGGRVPDTNAVKCTLPIKYFNLLVLL
jgi:hypothetical protein